jgi:hypothetical protein
MDFVVLDELGYLRVHGGGAGGARGGKSCLEGAGRDH